ncbi:MAG: GlsB/YeaQ/YmgE family stress response membrane protein [Patescibacteria group bacterium]
MSIIIFLIIGLIAGWLASIVMNTNREQGPIADIIVGILGAVVAGVLMNMVGGSAVDGLNLYSIAVATAGAIIVLWLKKMLIKA